MARGDSVVAATAGFGGDVFDTALRGFFVTLPVLRLAPAVRVFFFPLVLFLAIDASSWLFCIV
jgi:hypothetical protein